MNTIPTQNTPATRETWCAKMEEANRRHLETQAVYAAHMHKAGQHLYVAGECVKRGEYGSADSYHALANQCLDAAVRCLPV